MLLRGELPQHDHVRASKVPIPATDIHARSFCTALLAPLVAAGLLLSSAMPHSLHRLASGLSHSPSAGWPPRWRPITRPLTRRTSPRTSFLHIIPPFFPSSLPQGGTSPAPTPSSRRDRPPRAGRATSARSRAASPRSRTPTTVSTTASPTLKGTRSACRAPSPHSAHGRRPRTNRCWRCRRANGTRTWWPP